MQNIQKYIMQKIQETVDELDVGAGAVEGQPRHILDKPHFSNTGFLFFMQGTKVMKSIYYEFQDDAKFSDQPKGASSIGIDTHNTDSWTIEYHLLDKKIFRVPSHDTRLHLDGGIPAFQRVIRRWYSQ